MFGPKVMLVANCQASGWRHRADFEKTGEQWVASVDISVFPEGNTQRS